MRVLKTMSVIALGIVLTAGAAWAQTPPPATQKPAAQPPATQKPAAETQKPAVPAPSPAPEAAKPRPPAPFPEGAKIAYVDFNYIAATSEEGKAASAKIQELQKKRAAELTAKQKELQGRQEKLQQGLSVMNETARASAEREIEKLQRELQFAQQDAQSDVEQLTQQLQNDFGQRLQPIIDALANEKGLHMILQAQQWIAWANPGLDLSDEIVKRLNAAKGTPPKKN